MLDVVNLACERGERRLFQDLNFSVESGTLLHVQGPNGSGKTTLLRTLCGLSLPARGEIRWDGQNIRRLGEDYHAEMSYVGHLNGIKDDLTALENLQVTGRLMGGASDEEHILDVLERMGLSACIDLPGKVLSQGQRRRLALSRLLLSRKKLWILDEPFNALDVKAVGVMQVLFGAHLNDGGMVILTTHQEVEISASNTRHLYLGA